MSFEFNSNKNFQLKGRDGEVKAETIVPMFKSMFMAMSILTIMRAPEWTTGDEVVLDFRPFEMSTLKIFVDGLYNCNVDQIAVAEILKLLEFMSRFAFTKISKQSVEFACNIKE